MNLNNDHLQNDDTSHDSHKFIVSIVWMIVTATVFPAIGIIYHQHTKKDTYKESFIIELDKLDIMYKSKIEDMLLVIDSTFIELEKPNKNKVFSLNIVDSLSSNFSSFLFAWNTRLYSDLEEFGFSEINLNKYLNPYNSNYKSIFIQINESFIFSPENYDKEELFKISEKHFKKNDSIINVLKNRIREL